MAAAPTTAGIIAASRVLVRLAANNRKPVAAIDASHSSWDRLAPVDRTCGKNPPSRGRRRNGISRYVPGSRLASTSTWGSTDSPAKPATTSKGAVSGEGSNVPMASPSQTAPTMARAPIATIGTAPGEK